MNAAEKEPYTNLWDFDPAAFMEQWLKQHPEVLEPYIAWLKRKGEL